MYYLERYFYGYRMITGFFPHFAPAVILGSPSDCVDFMSSIAVLRIDRVNAPANCAALQVSGLIKRHQYLEHHLGPVTRKLGNKPCRRVPGPREFYIRHAVVGNAGKVSLRRRYLHLPLQAPLPRNFRGLNTPLMIDPR